MEIPYKTTGTLLKGWLLKFRSSVLKNLKNLKLRVLPNFEGGGGGFSRHQDDLLSKAKWTVIDLVQIKQDLVNLGLVTFNRQRIRRALYCWVQFIG